MPLSVRTDSGKVYSYELSPGKVAQVVVPLAVEDLWPAGPDTGWCLLILRAEGWTPQIVMPGSGDSRRLGASLLGVSQYGQILYERPGL